MAAGYAQKRVLTEPALSYSFSGAIGDVENLCKDVFVIGKGQGPCHTNLLDSNILLIGPFFIAILIIITRSETSGLPQRAHNGLTA